VWKNGVGERFSYAKNGGGTQSSSNVDGVQKLAPPLREVLLLLLPNLPLDTLCSTNAAVIASRRDLGCSNSRTKGSIFIAKGEYHMPSSLCLRPMSERSSAHPATRGNPPKSNEFL
jgi:hypothetical protein